MGHEQTIYRVDMQWLVGTQWCSLLISGEGRSNGPGQPLIVCEVPSTSPPGPSACTAT